ncbi:MAG: bile acid:sodium symporter family protein [Bacteroidales bacterium]|jgi:BASS family bile acid:Na+ symporter|nr:bile acid:sodium symporter family protein [Bacteroidales bacterium]MDD4256433.1 bile acid:sodium symporter family protein [Bacteroidales bacterium]MDD4654676.1 bile acid:sodium symporter family protein [Bacteroidales bacterium]MDD4828273.1 bile acid:sodium symporter family protein [Bacteroidales bacterium]
MYEQLLNLDNIRLNFSAGGMRIINIVLALVMFGVALGINPSEFKTVFVRPKSAIIGLVSQWILLPAMTFLLILIFRNQITPMVAMGMILVASCPGGNISNFMSSLSKANTELSISLTAITTSAATLVTPFNFAFWGGLYTRFLSRYADAALQPLHIDIWQTLETVFILLGIPLVLGMLFVRFFPKIAEKMKKPFQYFSLLFFIAMVVLSFSNNFDLFLDYIFYIFIIVLIHNALALGIGYAAGSAFKLPVKDRRTLTIEVGIQNSGLGLVLLFNPKIFPPELALGGMLFITAWWGVWHIISGLSVSFAFRYADKRRRALIKE